MCSRSVVSFVAFGYLVSDKTVTTLSSTALVADAIHAILLNLLARKWIYTGRISTGML